MISFSQTDYYYYKGEKVFLTKNYQYINIVTANAFDETQLNSAGVEPFALLTETKMRNGEFKKYSKLEFTTTPGNQNVYEQEIAILKTMYGIEGVYPYYDYHGNVFGVSNYFYVKLYQSSDFNTLQSIATQKNIDIEYQLTRMPLWYKISANSATTESILALCAYFYESGLFSKVEPVFVGSVVEEFIMPQSASPVVDIEDCDLYDEGSVESLQWNLFNNSENPLADINVCDAWRVTKGEISATVIIDTGVFDDVDDLPVLASDVVGTSGDFYDNYYYNHNNSGPHGTYVAGIVGAIHGNSKAGGIAPNTQMLYIANELTSTLDAEAISYAVLDILDQPQVGVVNMSIASLNPPNSGLLEEAIDSLSVYGHFMSGVVFIAAAGNDPILPIGSPANYDNVLAVGGSDTEGEYNTALTFGSGLDLSAPSMLVPTASQNNNGFDPSFGGTSAAAPHVSGIAALMMSADDISDDDGIPIKAEAVKNILKRTAQKSGNNFPYGFDFDHQFLNGLGSWNDHMGYGIPDATVCVKTAEAFTTTAGQLDIHMRNSTNDYGFEPDNVTRHANYVLWNSPDIWIRNNGDYSLEHENPVQGTNVTVFVKIVNKSNTPLTNGAQVVLHWSKLGGYANSWPSYWDGNTTLGNNVIIGDIVGAENIPAINPGEQAIVQFNWQVPNASDFTGITTDSEGNDINLEGFSLVARIVSNNDQMVSDLTPFIDSDGNAYGNVWFNAKNNNNFVWKNVEVVNGEPNPKPGTITIINKTNETKEYSLEFVVDDNPVGNVIFEEAEVKIQMDSDLFQGWATKGSIKNNFVVTNQEFKVSEDDAIIDNISLEAGEIRTLPITFNFLVTEVSNKKEFTYHYTQRDKVTGDIVYGKTFYIKKGETTPFDADAGNDKEIDKNQSVTLSATTIDDPATYNWYDPDGNLIYTGQDFTLSPEYTKQYTLEIIKDADGLTDYDTVTVAVNPFVFGVLSPNPASNQVTIDYIAEDASSAYFIFTAQSTGNTYNHIIDTQVTQKPIDISSYPTGIYIVSLICDGNLIESKQLIVN